MTALFAGRIPATRPTSVANTSAASIPLALHEMSESGLLQPGQQLACIGFGGGLTWGGMLLTYKGRENETAE